MNHLVKPPCKSPIQLMSCNSLLLREKDEASGSVDDGLVKFGHGRWLLVVVIVLVYEVGCGVTATGTLVLSLGLLSIGEHHAISRRASRQHDGGFAARRASQQELRRDGNIYPRMPLTPLIS